MSVHVLCWAQCVWLILGSGLGLMGSVLKAGVGVHRGTQTCRALRQLSMIVNSEDVSTILWWKFLLVQH